jgi:hypothetical protein
MDEPLRVTRRHRSRKPGIKKHICTSGDDEDTMMGAKGDKWNYNSEEDGDPTNKVRQRDRKWGAENARLR